MSKIKKLFLGTSETLVSEIEITFPKTFLVIYFILKPYILPYSI